jgi:hypothetical protein
MSETLPDPADDGVAYGFLRRDAARIARTVKRSEGYYQNTQERGRGRYPVGTGGGGAQIFPAQTDGVLPARTVAAGNTPGKPGSGTVYLLLDTVQAALSATVAGGVITALKTNNAGVGYSSAPTVQVTDSTGTGASVTAAANPDGTVTFTLAAGGTGYTAPAFEVTGGVTVPDLTTLGAKTAGVLSNYLVAIPTAKNGWVVLRNGHYWFLVGDC